MFGNDIMCKIICQLTSLTKKIMCFLSRWKFLLSWQLKSLVFLYYLDKYYVVLCEGNVMKPIMTMNRGYV